MAEPIGDTTTATGQRLRPGEFLRDAEGNWFRVYDVGGGKLRLAPVTADGKLLAPKSQWKSPTGAYENELGQLIQTDIQGSVTTSRTIPWSDWAGGAGGGGTAAPQWRPGELDLERQQLQANIAATEQRLKEIVMQEASADERQRLQLQAEREMLVMRLENDRRTLVYGEYGATARQKMANQQSAREMKFGLREDPFALGAAMQGMPMLAGTPTQQYRGELTDFINQPIPQMSITAPIPQMEAALQNLGGGQMPMPQSTFGLPGMAEGGRIEMEKGADGAFSMKSLGGRKQTVLVGDGAGIIPGITEAQTIEYGPFGIKSVEVTPLAGRAQAGMSLDDSWSYDPEQAERDAQAIMRDVVGLESLGIGPLTAVDALRVAKGLARLTPSGVVPVPVELQPVTPSPPSPPSPPDPNQERWGMVQQLAPLWKDLSPGGVPGHMQTAGRLSRFGYSPRLVKVGDRYWIRGPTGQYREIASSFITGPQAANYSGLPMASSATVLKDMNELAQLGPIGPGLSTAGLQDFLYSLSRPNLTGTAGAMSAPITTNVFGLPMPAIHKAAGTLSRMFADPFSSSTVAPPILSAYQNAMIGGVPAGISPDALRNIVGSYTPQAGGFGGRRLGFTGGFL